MRLPDADSEFLERAGIEHRVFEDGGMLNVELIDFPLPTGLSASKANVLFRLSPNYPDTAPDMWWVIPHLVRTGGGAIAATESIEQYEGRQWQRWSRHLDADAWRSGIDGIESSVRLLRNELVSAAA